MGKNGSDDIATTSWTWASTERQQFLVLHHGHSKRCALALTHNQCIGRLYRQKCKLQYCYHLLKMSVNGVWTIFWSCILDHLRATEWRWPIINSSAAFIGKYASDDITTTSQRWVPREHSQFLVLHHGHSKRSASPLTHNQFSSVLYGPKCYLWYRYHLRKMSVNGVSTIFGHASWII